MQTELIITKWLIMGAVALTLCLATCNTSENYMKAQTERTVAGMRAAEARANADKAMWEKQKSP